MAAKMDQALALKRAEECARTLVDALKHPTIGKEGRLGFNAKAVLSLIPPVSRVGLPCTKGDSKVLNLEQLSVVASHQRRLIRRARQGVPKGVKK